MLLLLLPLPCYVLLCWQITATGARTTSDATVEAAQFQATSRLAVLGMEGQPRTKGLSLLGGYQMPRSCGGFNR